LYFDKEKINGSALRTPNNALQLKQEKKKKKKKKRRRRS
jgi:hypothetical protein